MAEFVLGEILVARDQRIEVEGLLVHIADVDVVNTGARLIV